MSRGVLPLKQGTSLQFPSIGGDRPVNGCSFAMTEAVKPDCEKPPFLEWQSQELPQTGSACPASSACLEKLHLSEAPPALTRRCLPCSGRNQLCNTSA